MIEVAGGAWLACGVAGVGDGDGDSSLVAERVPLVGGDEGGAVRGACGAAELLWQCYGFEMRLQALNCTAGGHRTRVKCFPPGSLCSWIVLAHRFHELGAMQHYIQYSRDNRGMFRSPFAPRSDLPLFLHLSVAPLAEFRPPLRSFILPGHCRIPQANRVIIVTIG